MTFNSITIVSLYSESITLILLISHAHTSTKKADNMSEDGMLTSLKFDQVMTNKTL